MITIILAGGLGRNMDSNYPQVLFKVRNLPMIVKPINHAIRLQSELILIVVNKETELLIKKIVKKNFPRHSFFYVVQDVPQGTGHAIQCCLPYLQEFDPLERILILNGDMPLLSFYTIYNFIKWNNPASSRILSIKLDNKEKDNFARVFRNETLKFKYIKEHDECTDEEKKNPYVNVGVYLLENQDIQKNINKMTTNNKLKEYFITDLINHINPVIFMLEQKFKKEIVNFNDQKTIKKIDRNF